MIIKSKEGQKEKEKAMKEYFVVIIFTISVIE